MTALVRGNVRWAIAITALALLALPLAARADDIWADGDGLAPVNNNNMDFGTVCAGQTYTKTALIAVRRAGNVNSGNVFANGASVAVSVSSTTGSGLSATASGSIALPGNWESQSTGTLSSGTVSSTVTLTPSGGGSQTGVVTYIASGTRAAGGGGGILTVSDTMNVSWTVVTCDSTPPVITATVSGNLGNNGWYISDVTVSWTVTDPESPITSQTGCVTITISTDTSGQTLTCTATSAGGTSSQSVTIKRDATLPTITFVSQNPAANSEGWNNTDVTVQWSCADATSGVVATTVSKTVTTEGANQSVTGTCEDKAGNTASNTRTSINIDKSSPSITGTRTPAANSYGWNNSAVTVSFTCSDAISGIASCSGPTTLSSEGAGQSVTGTAIDKAGNSATATVANINIDLTPPTIGTPIVSPAPNSHGWNNTDVTVTWPCADTLSGPVTSPVTKTVTTEGANQSVTGTCEDKAGNSVSDTKGGINIDKTKPTLSPSISPSSGTTVVLNSSATASPNATDTLSGIASASCDPVDTSSVGQKSLTCTATDKAGNTQSVTVTYTVVYAPATMPCVGAPGRTILQPINADGTSVFKQGSTVPAKFRVCDAKGVSIGTPGVVTDFKLAQVIQGTATDVNEPVDSTTPDSSFRWSATDQLWIFNINTKSLQAGKTYVYRITLNDGTTIEFKFGLK